MVLLSSVPSMVIFDFNKDANIGNWFVVDDGVMGGRSAGNFTLNDDGHGVFQGEVSLENNGGFSSVRYRFATKVIEGQTKAVLRLKGDGKNYQFRVKPNYRDYYSYIYEFTTNGEWQEIEIPLAEMAPAFRGRQLDLPNFSDDHLEEVTFLIGNKRNERFKLIIDKIELK